jgi:hypothetical protein
VRAGKIGKGPTVYGALSVRDLDLLLEHFEKINKEAAMRALEGISLGSSVIAAEPHRLPPPAPG